MSSLEPVQKLDPRGVGSYLDPLANLASLGRHHEAMNAIEAGLRVEPDNMLLKINRAARPLAWKGDTTHLREVVREVPREGQMVELWFWYLIFSRQFEEAIELAEAHPLEPVADPANYIEQNNYAVNAYLGSGERQNAAALVQVYLEDFEAAIARVDEFLSDQKFFTTEYIRADPAFDPIRDMPEFQAVLEKHSS